MAYHNSRPRNYYCKGCGYAHRWMEHKQRRTYYNERRRSNYNPSRGRRNSNSYGRRRGFGQF